MSSGSVHMPNIIDSIQENRRKGNMIARNVNCSGDDQDILINATEIIQCLRRKGVAELLYASKEIPQTGSFMPTFQDRVLPKYPPAAMERGFFSHVPVLVGGSSDEGAFDLIRMHSKLLVEQLEKYDQHSFERYLSELLSSGTRIVVPELLKYYKDQALHGDRNALRRLYTDYQSDLYYNCHVQYFAEKYSKKGNSVYRYVFDYKYTSSTAPKWTRAAHGEDFKHYFAAPLSTSSTFSKEDMVVSETLAQIIGSFAKYG